MLERSFTEFGADGAAMDRAADLRCSALVGRTILQAAATLAHMPREAALPALASEAEQLALSDAEAAEQALASLLQVRDCLKRAIADVRMGRMVGAALLRAAAALPDESSEEAA